MSQNLIWIDLEMTGLDAETQVIIEIASIITDNEMNIIAEGPNIVIHYPEEALHSMEEWSRTHHTASGLLDQVRASNYDCETAEQKTLSFLSKHCNKGESPLCGNTIWQDRRFLIKHMPQLEAFFHYRNIDISSIKELVQRWYPEIPPFEKNKPHLALDDIRESIEELKFYRRTIFK